MDEEFRIWIEKAGQDFDTAEYNLKGNKLEAAAFFFQQCAEKSLKAVYIKRFGKFPKIHDLVSLAKDLNASGNFIEGLRLLTLAYQYTRYPDISKEDEVYEEINELRVVSLEVLKWAKKHL